MSAIKPLAHPTNGSNGRQRRIEATLKQQAAAHVAESDTCKHSLAGNGRSQDEPSVQPGTIENHARERKGSDAACGQVDSSAARRRTASADILYLTMQG